MKGGPWRWRREGAHGGWTARWASFLEVSAEASPWICLGLAILMLHMLGGTMTAERGFLFDLPSAKADDGDGTSLVALVAAMPGGTLVFFDDSRYSMGDAQSVDLFASHLCERVAASPGKTLLVLADKRVPAGDLMDIAAVARKSDVKRVLFAAKRPGGRSE